MKNEASPSNTLFQEQGIANSQRLRLLFEISQILEQSLDMRDVVSPVLDALSQYMNMLYGTIMLLNRDTNDIMIEAAHGLSPQQTRRGRYKLGEGITGKVVLSGKPAIIPRTSESNEFLNKLSQNDGANSSFLCVPIKVANEVIGALSVAKPYDPQANLQEDANLLNIVASQISQAVRLRQAAQEERDRLENENERLRAELKNRFRPSNIIGNSHEMQLVYDQIAQVSKSNACVLVQGETGTGKELVAHALHYNSNRADKPFIRAHCAALPENIIESELFGHERGAFTGATSERKGRFELAHGGTLFLDEIGDVPMTIQVKLLRVLQEKEFERVGGTKTIKTNVRLIVATNRNLEDMVAEGTFREDLFYRLNVFPIYVPALRKRKTDIMLLSDHFLQKYARENSKKIRRLSSPVIDMLMSYHWPGNVRELENCIERSVLVAEGDVVLPHHLPPTLQTEQVSGGGRPAGDLKSMVDAFECDLIRDALKSCRGNMAAAARHLQSTPRILGYKVTKYGIKPKQYAS